jgi:predicted O-methyltransferase YrrM
MEVTMSYVPRFSFEISEEQKQRADRLLDTYGLRKAVFNVILDDLLNLIESSGPIVIGAILSKAAKPQDILPSMSYAKSKGD